MVKRVGLVAAALLILLSAGCAQVPLVGQSNFGGRQEPLFGEKRVGQDFVSSDRNLNRVDVYLYPSKILVPDQDTGERRRAERRLAGKSVVMRLSSGPEGRRLATVAIPATRVAEPGMHSFKFEPIAESKGRGYYWEIAAPELTDKLAMAVALTHVDRYGEGRAYVDGEAQPESDARFEPYIRMNSRMLFGSIASRLLSDRPFMVVWGLMVSAVFVGAVAAWRADAANRT
jgi:hypothetical protein